MTVEGRQHTHVLRAAGGLLRPDDVGEVGDPYRDVLDLDHMRALRQLAVAAVEARRPKGDVELAQRAYQVPDGRSSKPPGVVVERQTLLDVRCSDPRPQLLERLGEALQIRPARLGGELDVPRRVDGRLLSDRS